MTAPVSRIVAAEFLRREADALLAGDPRDGVLVNYAPKILPRALEASGPLSAADRAAAYRARKRVTPAVTIRDENEQNVTELPQTPSDQKGLRVNGSGEGSSRNNAVSSTHEGACVRASDADRHVTNGKSRDVTKRVRAAGRKGFPPPDFAPKETHRSLASARNVDLALELAKFKDHEFLRPISDYDRAFANWIRSARSSAGGSGGGYQRPTDIRQKTTTPFDFSKVTANGKGGVY
ncbi:MAG TPA: hypothetical protein VFZ21_21120 [Gemmatimonadaceae bacterium]|nr:hypothetical protein [Gemmatimonadaceae bacterium]